jgi:phage-related protein
MAAVTSAFAKGDDSMEALTAQNQVLNKQIDEQKKKLDQLRQGLAQASEKYGDADKTTQGWQQAVNKATADLNNMERQLKENNREVENYGKKQLEAARNSEEFKNAQGKLQSSLNSLKMVAVAVAAAIGSVAAAFFKAGAAADDINTLAKQTGLTTEEIQKFQYAADLIDVPLETLTGSMARLTRNMANAQKGTGDAYYAFKNLGVSVTGAGGQLRDNQDVFNDVIDALGRMSNETQRDAYAMQIFGKSAQDLNPLILGGADALRRLGQEAEDAGLILSQESLDKLNAINDSVDTFKAQMKAGALTVLSEFAGPVQEALKKVDLKPLLDAMRWMLEHAREIAAVVVGVGTAFLTWKAIEVITSVVSAFAILTKAIIGATAAQQGLNLAMLANPIGIVIAAIVGLVAAFAILIATNEDLRKAMTDGWGKITATISNGVNVIGNFFTQTIPNAFNAADAAVDQFVQNIITKITNMATELLQKITASAIRIKDKILEFGNQIITFFAELPGKIFAIGVNIVTGLWEGIQSKIAEITERITKFIQGIVDNIKSIFGIHSPSTVFAGIGQNMALGLGEGWANGMRSVAKNMQASIPTNFNIPAANGGYYSAAAARPATAAQPITRQPIIIQLTQTLEGRQLAKGVYPYILEVGELTGTNLVKG